MGMERTDAELMRLWQQGEARAFEDLVRRWQDRIARLLARLVGPQAVPDLCQEVFLRLYLAGPHYREKGAFTTWLYRIAINVARDTARRRPPPLALDDHEPLDHFAPPEALCRRETVDLVTRALEALSAPQREVLVLRHYEDLAFEEIARLTGIPASTLKSRFTAALTRLRLVLEEQGWQPEDTEP